ncbi:uncharacterized protein FSUBG_6142 [Fusarium subglutinans]|uniref:Uncharacterized protein n=1 Tax=Gibberella subglutinans TaxID=42677 RepID=A0A8H5Q0H1_GIBSU|nr:uncharacterized protein FSUBG_6142 [Fusarium subglutinans]KAF5606309.1 hypothetical protein FSUBG_6142 [Fusarium subglutinans]
MGDRRPLEYNLDEPLEELSERRRRSIQEHLGSISEAGTARTGSSLRTADIDLDRLSEHGRHILAARMNMTRNDWDKSEFLASTVNGGSVTHSHKASQVGFGNLRSSPQTQRAPAVPALTTRVQKVPRNLGGGPLAGGFAPASKAPTATGAFVPATKPPSATSAFAPASTTRIGGFAPSTYKPIATGAFVPPPTAPTGISSFVAPPKAPTATGGPVPGSRAPTVISATTTVVRDPSVNQGLTTTIPSPKRVRDASQLGTGSLAQTEEQFRELIDEMAALQQNMSLNEQKQRWLFFNLQKQRKGTGEKYD